MSDFLRPHGLQPARPPCPSPTPGVHSNSCPSSRCCHPTISLSVVPFSSCPRSFPASGSFQMSHGLPNISGHHFPIELGRRIPGRRKYRQFKAGQCHSLQGEGSDRQGKCFLSKQLREDSWRRRRRSRTGPQPPGAAGESLQA